VEVERLYFGERARRRLRRARVKRAVVALWIVAVGAGVPGATAILDWTEQAVPGGSPRTYAITGHPIAPAAGVIHAKEMKAELHTTQVKLAASPSPEPPSPAPYPPTSTTGVIYAAAAEFGLDPAYLLSVASCESGLNRGAYNAAGYHGLFQFDQTTWAAYGYGSIYDPSAQARTAARLIAAGQSSRWPNCA